MPHRKETTYGAVPSDDVAVIRDAARGETSSSTSAYGGVARSLLIGVGVCVVGVVALSFSSSAGLFNPGGEAAVTGVISYPANLYLGDADADAEGRTVQHDGDEIGVDEDDPRRRLAPKPEVMKPMRKFTLHTACVPDEIKAKDAEFWQGWERKKKRHLVSFFLCFSIFFVGCLFGPLPPTPASICHRRMLSSFPLPASAKLKSFPFK